MVKTYSLVAYIPKFEAENIDILNTKEVCGANRWHQISNVSDDTNFTWKFNRKGGSCPSISAIKADKGTFSSIRNAISYAITGAKVGSVEYVVLHLLDDNGDSWVIERSTKKFRVFKNRQLIENDLKKDFTRNHFRSRFKRLIFRKKYLR